MPKAADGERIDAWRALLRAHSAAVQSIEADLVRAGVLPLHWYDVLLELQGAPEHGLRMAELGERVVLSRSRSSRVVDELERLGYARRTPDPGDGRASLALITPAGRRALRRAAPTYLRSIEQHFTRHLTDAERQTIAVALGRVAAAAKAKDDRPRGVDP